MKHRIAAGVIVEQAGRILLVRHRKPGVYDFWVAPGGGAEGTEDLRDYWRDKETGFAHPRYVGVREMEFY